MRRILTLAGNVLRSNLKDLSFPYKLTYIVTHRCQLICTMCNIWQKNPHEELSLDQIDEFFARYNRFSWINLSGGELVLRSDFSEIVGTIHKRCKNLFLLNFPTNGYRPDLIVPVVEKILAVHRFPRLLVSVSIDGPPDVHDRIRNVPGSWEKAVETFGLLRRYRGRRFNVFVGLTLQEANSAFYDATVDAVRNRIGSFTHDEVHVNIAHRSSHYYGNQHVDHRTIARQSPSQLARMGKLRRTTFFDPVSLLERKYQKLAVTFAAAGRTPIPCQALSASLFMDPAGTVYPCSTFDHPVGSVKDHSFDLSTLWDTEQRRDLRRRIRAGECPQCWTPCEAYQSILASLVPGINRLPRASRD